MSDTDMPSSMDQSYQEVTYFEAIHQGIQEEMVRDETVCYLGTGYARSVSNVQLERSLQDQFGPQRVLSLPPSESGLLGAAVGSALMGMRPVITLPDGDRGGFAFDQTMRMAAQLYAQSGGAMQVPFVLRIPIHEGEPGREHPELNPHRFLAHIPGLKVVLPSTPYDARGLMKAAIRDNNPVIFLEEMYLYHRLRELLPTDDYVVEPGTAEVRIIGKQLTVLTYGAMIYPVLEVAESLATNYNITAEVIDLRSLAPLDMELITDSVKETNRLLIVHDEARAGGIGAEIAARVGEELLDMLDAPVLRIADAHILQATVLRLFNIE